MSALDDATSVKRGIDLDGVLGIFQGAIDPSVSGWDAPIGSLFIRTNGSLYQKETAPTTGWVLKAAGLHKDTHKIGGSDAFTATDILDAVVKRLQETAGPTILTVGDITDGQFLRRDGTTIIGVDPADTGPEHDTLNAAPILGSQETSQVYVDMPGATVTTAAGVSRDYLVVFTGSVSVSKAGKIIVIRLMIDGVPDDDSEREIQISSASAPVTIATCHAGTVPPGAVIKVQWKLAGTAAPSATLEFGTLSAIGVE